jgi:hypothetical protein
VSRLCLCSVVPRQFPDQPLVLLKELLARPVGSPTRVVILDRPDVAPAHQTVLLAQGRGELTERLKRLAVQPGQVVATLARLPDDGIHARAAVALEVWIRRERRHEPRIIAILPATRVRVFLLPRAQTNTSVRATLGREKETRVADRYGRWATAPRKPVADALARREQIEAELDPVLCQVARAARLDEDRAVRLLVARSRRDTRVAQLLLERAALRGLLQQILARSEADRVLG